MREIGRERKKDKSKRIKKTEREAGKIVR